MGRFVEVTSVAEIMGAGEMYKQYLFNLFQGEKLLTLLLDGCNVTGPDAYQADFNTYEPTFRPVTYNTT
jgi:hypothetical protein